MGSSGLTVSRICVRMMSYGDPASCAWHIGEQEAEPIVRGAVEAGVTFFDTADMYWTRCTTMPTSTSSTSFARSPAERGLPAAQIALAWLLARPAVTAPIVGATKLSHLEDALAAIEVALREEEVARLETAYRPHPVLGHD